MGLADFSEAQAARDEKSNECHRLLDVTYHEDHNQTSDYTCAQCLTLMGEISAKIEGGHPMNGAIRAECGRAMC